MRAAAQHMQPSAAISFLLLLPKRYHRVKLHTLALRACAAGRDYACALEVMMDPIGVTSVDRTGLNL